MSRVLIIGSSHVGAYKNAAARFTALYPKVELSFFGMRAPLFLTGQMNRKGRFKPNFRDQKDRDFVKQTNGALFADASQADHVVMLGHRFDFNNVAVLFEDHDILEGVRTGRPRVISEDFVQDVIATQCNGAVAQAAGAIKAYDKPVTFVMAPYPASSILERGDEYPLARTLGQFWARPDAAWIFGMWLEAVQLAIESHGHALLPQADALNAGPFATKPEFASRAAALDGDLSKTDHRHMNADYGLAMLSAYANTHLGMTPRADEQPPLNERTA